MSHIDNNDNQSSGGIFSKFQERLRKIRLSRNKKYIQNQKFVEEKVKEIQETILNDSPPTYKGKTSKKAIFPDNIKNNGKDIDKKEDDTISKVIVDIRDTVDDRDYGKRKPAAVDKDDVKVVNKLPKDKEFALIKDNKLINQNVNKSVDKNASNIDSFVNVKEQKPKKIRGARRAVYSSAKFNKEHLKNVSDNEKEVLLEKMKIEILDKLKSCFEDKLDELEILESELFFLKHNQDNELQLKKIKEIKERINELIGEVNAIIEQYNLYAKNYYIDNIVGIDDNVIVDDLISYRDLLDSFADEKKFVKDYKSLEEFKNLYKKLKSVKADAEHLIDSNEEKINEFDIRDKKYDNIKLKVLQIDRMNQRCEFEIGRQNEYLLRLMKNVDKIDKVEYTTYRMRGIDSLIGMSLRYMGLMIAMPLSGILPSIGVQALATRRMLGNIYQNMNMEEVKHVYYSAADYDSELNYHLFDINYVSTLLGDTLRDVQRLKKDFMLQYDSRIPGYNNTLKKIQNMEKIILRNQNKVNIIKKNLKVSKKLNEEKQEKVRKLNEKQ